MRSIAAFLFVAFVIEGAYAQAPMKRFHRRVSGRAIRRSGQSVAPADDSARSPYRIRNLPPGDYLAAAVSAMSLPLDGEWDPAFFEKVRPAATGLKLIEGQTLALNLDLIE